MTTQCPKCKAENTDTARFCSNCANSLQPSKDIPAQTRTIETPVQELTRGTLFADRYEIIEELGTGGMGKVYRVDDTKAKEEIALKLIKPEIAADKKTIERFRNELTCARKIRHKNICGMYDLGEDNGSYYITMEYVSGEDLKSLLRRVKKISIDTAVSITKQICEGLIEAHRIGIVHRDLKPSNIMIDKAGNARIMDFGIARSVKGEALTGENVIVGTPDYMSPEQVEGKEVDQRSDIYSLGVVLFEMLTGERPFKGDTSLSIAMKHKSEAPPNPKWLNDQIPDSLSRLVLMCLDKDKERRYQTAEELLSALSEIDEKKIQIADKGEKKKSIVVLPFENLSPEPEQEYFCDGMTEEIISDLSNVKALRVISRSSAMTFKGTKKKIKEIAQEVNVNYVLEGSVRKAGNNLRITAQLIDATTDEHLWAEKYRGTLDEVFDIQEKVSRSIVDALKLKLNPEEDKKLAERPIDNAQAYEFYMRARQELWKYTDDSLQRALQHLKNGLDIIGENILFYSGIGYVYYQYFDSKLRTDQDYSKKVEEYANKIFEIDPDSAHAHRLLGLLKLKKENTKDAYKHFKRAYKIDPDDPDTILWTTACLAIYFGKPSIATPIVQRALKNDPLTLINHWLPGCVYWAEGKFEKALESVLKWQQMEPDSIMAKWYVAQLLLWNQRDDEAYEFIDKLAKDAPQHLFTQLILFLKFAFQKKKKEAFTSFTEDVKKWAWNDFHLPWYVAECFASLDERNVAMDWLEHAVNRGFINYPLFAELDPFLENIRGEPRFKKLMERVKHEWENFEV